jgi:hypothetical protein
MIMVPGAAAPPAAERALPRPFTIEPVDPAGFSALRIAALRHDYHRHPLMELGALRRLAKDLLPIGKCRFLAPGATQRSEFSTAAKSYDGRDIDAVFDRITEPGSWIALYNVESDPEYRGFLEEVTKGARALVEREQPGMFMVRGFIFISAPPSVTPFHIDRENNFWLQVRGRKVMTLWDPDDRATVSHRAVEDFILYRTLESVRLADEAMKRAHHFDVGPGQGVYFPSTSAHMTRSERDWVAPGDEVSISIGVVFYTAVTRRHAHVHAWNGQLRKLGVAPAEPGGPWDTVKAPLGRLAVAVRSRLRDYERPPGF